MRKKRQAFTLMEIMLVVVVIGVVATIAAPRIMRKAPSAKWENVMQEINNLVAFARQEAIANYKTYRLHFKVNKQYVATVGVELQGDDPEKKGRKIYTPIKSYYFTPIYKFPDGISLVAVHHTKENELDEQNQNAYCYVIPNGLVQETFVHLEKEESGLKSQVTFQMQPFFGRFEMQEGFARPGR